VKVSRRTFWNLVDWVTLCVSVALLASAFWLYYWVDKTSSLTILMVLLYYALAGRVGINRRKAPAWLPWLGRR